MWSMLVFFFWFAVIWMFITVFADIIRRDMSGWAKAGWVVLIVVLPFLGILVYLVSRPKFPDEDRKFRSHREALGYSPADDIATAARLHEDGTITADEFERLKHQALRY
jgi:hypothetical protein